MRARATRHSPVVMVWESDRLHHELLPPKLLLCSSDGPRTVHGNAIPRVGFVSTPRLQQLLAQPVAYLLNSRHDRLIKSSLIPRSEKIRSCYCIPEIATCSK